MDPIGKIIFLIVVVFAFCGCKTSSEVSAAQPKSVASPVQYYGHSAKPTPRLSFIESADLGQGLQIIRQEIHHEAVEKIEILYPQIIGSFDPAIAKLNLAIKSFITQGRFPVKRKKESHLKFSYEYEIAIKYSVEFVSAEILSIAFHEYWNAFGAAQPGQSYITFNYNLKKHKPIGLHELFLKDSKYLERLVNYCHESLSDQTGYPVEGLSPEIKNFTKWHLTQTSLCIDFDRCEHMPCAPGEQIVAIPYSELRDILNFEGVLRSVVSQ